jgi:hypothetical protein
MKKILLYSIIIIAFAQLKSQSLTITNPNTKARFQVYDKDLPGGKIDWLSAKKACSALGSGWRLPTKKEFQLIYEEWLNNKNRYYSIDSYSHYWTGDEDSDSEGASAWTFYFPEQASYSFPKDVKCYARAVRSL